MIMAKKLNEVFIVIENDKQKDDFLKQLFRPASLCYELLDGILNHLKMPFTIINESNHIDASYRDTYYMYFSNKHFDIERYSKRFSFFRGRLSYLEFIEIGNDKKIQGKFMGSLVINPIGDGLIGKTLLAPQYVVNKEKYPVFIRTSKFVLNVLGKRLEVEAFPYRMQDRETMTCAEVTLLNILEYFSNSYHDYKSVTPSEIIKSEQEHNHERVLPSRGITYPVLTKVLSDFGFSPRLYNVFAIKNPVFSKRKQIDELRRWIYYYIESGIPIAMNFNPVADLGVGHSVVCIGHGRKNDQLKKKAYSNMLCMRGRKMHPLINAADFYDDYVIMDDNASPYKFFNIYDEYAYNYMQITNIAVPLYKRMFLDAPNAADLIYQILQHESYGIMAWEKGYLTPEQPVIVRIFMASSRSFKRFRVSTLESLEERMLYSNLRLPRFVWVCELYTEQGFEENRAFAELVVDATASGSRGIMSVLLMHYPKVITIRNPEDNDPDFKKQFELSNVNEFDGFNANLTIIK